LKESEGQKFLTTEEVGKEYGWAKGTLYYFRDKGYLNSYKFILDKRIYWRQSDLEAIKNRPPEEKKRGPKPPALITAKSGRARGRTVGVGTGILTPAAI
jgi:hypothetical protein